MVACVYTRKQKHTGVTIAKTTSKHAPEESRMTFIERMDNFIKSGLSENMERARNLRKIEAVNIFTLLAFIASTTLVVLDIATKQTSPLFTTIKAGIAVLMASSIIALRATKSHRLANVFGKLILGFTLLQFITILFFPQFTSIGIFSLSFFPIVSFYFEGKKQGLIWTLSFLAIMLVAIVVEITHGLPRPALYHTSGVGEYRNYLLQAFFVFAVVSVFVYLYAALRERNEAIIKRQLESDPLTGLPNRSKLIKDIERAKGATLVIMNIDNFKEINNFYGLPVGDYILISLTHQLGALLIGTGYTLYKLPADEFAFFAQKRIPHDMVKEMLAGFHKEIEGTVFEVDPHEITIDVTFGIVNEQGSLLEKADLARRSAKRHKKNHHFYTPNMPIIKEFEYNQKWMHIIKDALVNNRIVTHYQPIINNTTGRVEKYEALLRLINDKGGIVTPDFFLNVAKRSKYYSLLTRFVVKSACEMFRDNNYVVSVNLCVQDILNSVTVDFIEKTILTYDIAERIILEITESEGIEQYEEVRAFIKQMKRLGCRIAIDDFGAGYANYEYLLRLNVDYIKIDGALIKDIDRNEISQVVVENICNSSHKLRIKTIAEFVHSESVYDRVRALDIDFSQGYYIGKPEETVETAGMTLASIHQARQALLQS